MTRITGEKRTKAMKWAGGILLGMGFIMLLGAVRLFFQSSVSSGWPTEIGVVTVSEVSTYNETRTYSERESPNSERTVNRTETVTMHKPNIVYSYTLHGVRYENDRLSFFDGASENTALADSILALYPVGKEVTVHYNPDDPGDAVLEPGSGVALIVPLVLGLFLCGFAAIPLLVVRAERKQAEAAA